MSFDSFLHKVNTAIKKARAILPTGRQLPYIVSHIDWPGGKPDYRSVRAFMEGKLKAHDFVGYEGHNQEALHMAEETGVRPKEYLFDPEEEGVDDRPSGENDLTFREWETYPPSIPTD